MRFRQWVPCLLAAGLAFAPGGAPRAGAAGAIGVDGASLTRDGAPFVPRGVTVVAMLAPPSPFPIYTEAAAHFGPAELDAIRAYGADTVRFQVSQAGLDPQSPKHDPGAVARVAGAVAAARGMGFTVILSMQSRGAGLPATPTMPDAATARAWAALLPRIAADPGVLPELFNEPLIKTGPPFDAAKFQALWARWRAAFQPLVTALRAGGDRSVLILDGVQTANFLDGAPAIDDPLHRLAYAVHPYFHGGNTGAAAWQRNFGGFAATHPVIATEWNTTPNVGCVPDAPALAGQLIAFLHARRIGLVGWAFDVPGTLVRDFSFAPTDFTGFHCGAGGAGGAGAAIAAAFRAR